MGVIIQYPLKEEAPCPSYAVSALLGFSQF